MQQKSKTVDKRPIRALNKFSYMFNISRTLIIWKIELIPCSSLKQCYSVQSHANKHRNRGILKIWKFLVYLFFISNLYCTHDHYYRASYFSTTKLFEILINTIFTLALNIINYKRVCTSCSILFSEKVKHFF